MSSLTPSWFEEDSPRDLMRWVVAAIPAVMIYNVLARSTAHYRASVGDVSAQVMKLVSRDLDRARLPLSHAAE